MRPAPVAPSDVERTFGADEIIVSKTDPKGVLTYVNDVFCRVSRYTEGELLGQPHNVIRHPDMPRCVFQLMWDTIGRGDEIFAYVKNLASDGAYYWVFAHITPTFDGTGKIIGYHSNRRSPERSALEPVIRLYRELLAVEQRHARPRDAIAASSQVLHDTLAARGLDYDQFVWSLTPGSLTPGSLTPGSLTPHLDRTAR